MRVSLESVLSMAVNLPRTLAQTLPYSSLDGVGPRLGTEHPCLVSSTFEPSRVAPLEFSTAPCVWPVCLQVHRTQINLHDRPCERSEPMTEGSLIAAPSQSLRHRRGGRRPSVCELTQKLMAMSSQLKFVATVSRMTAGMAVK
jgi:hypothetical protein